MPDDEKSCIQLFATFLPNCSILFAPQPILFLAPQPILFLQLTFSFRSARLPICYPVRAHQMSQGGLVCLSVLAQLEED